MAQGNTEIAWIDNFGNLYQGTALVGYYDSIDEKCFLMNGTETPCPTFDKEELNQATAKAKPTYWWVLFLGFIIAVIALAWWLNRK